MAVMSCLLPGGVDFSLIQPTQVLAYGQSDYVRQFGMRVNADGALQVRARILAPPKLKYGAGSKQVTIVGARYNMPS
jgi:eukaryotic translation initiation factor 2C